MEDAAEPHSEKQQQPSNSAQATQLAELSQDQAKEAEELPELEAEDEIEDVPSADAVAPNPDLCDWRVSTPAERAAAEANASASAASDSAAAEAQGASAPEVAAPVIGTRVTAGRLFVSLPNHLMDIILRPWLTAMDVAAVMCVCTNAYAWASRAVRTSFFSLLK